MTNCKIIQDLLPLYTDSVCSDESRILVEEHLKTCKKCKCELESMQSEVKITFNHEAVNVLKSIKRKILKKNVIVSLVSVAVAITLFAGVFNWVLLPETPIPYEDGLLKVEVNTTKYTYEDGVPLIITESDSTTMTFDEREVLDIVSSRKTACRSGASLVVTENDENVKLVFVNFTENLLSKLEKGGETASTFRIVEPQPDEILSENGENIIQAYDRIEVYYLNQKISESNTDDYEHLKSNGKLVWSGMLK